MFEPFHAGNIFSCAVPLLTACLILGAESRIASYQGDSQIAGTWRGNSVCAVPSSPCRDEVNVYRFSEIAGKPNRFSCTAGKIVDGREMVMGSGEWSYDASKRLLQTVTPNPTIRLTLDQDTLDGALTLPDGSIYRHIHLKKSRD